MTHSRTLALCIALVGGRYSGYRAARRHPRHGGGHVPSRSRHPRRHRLDRPGAPLPERTDRAERHRCLLRRAGRAVEFSGRHGRLAPDSDIRRLPPRGGRAGRMDYPLSGARHHDVLRWGAGLPQSRRGRAGLGRPVPRTSVLARHPATSAAERDRRLDEVGRGACRILDGEHHRRPVADVPPTILEPAGRTASAPYPRRQTAGRSVGADRRGAVGSVADQLPGLRCFHRPSVQPATPETRSGGSVPPAASRQSLALVAAAGRAGSDPVTSVPGARYFALGLRLKVGPPVLPCRPHPPRGTAAPFRIGPAVAAGREIVIQATEDESVELAGDFTDWKPVRFGAGARPAGGRTPHRSGPSSAGDPDRRRRLAGASRHAAHRQRVRRTKWRRSRRIALPSHLPSSPFADESDYWADE